MGATASFTVPRPTTTGRRGNCFGLNTSVPKPTTATSTGKELPHLHISVFAPDVTAHGLPGSLAQASITVPHPIITGLSKTLIAHGSIEVPLPEITITAGKRASIEVPLVDVTARGKTNLIGRASFSVPVPETRGKNGVCCSITIPLVDLTAHGLVGATGKAKVSVPAADITARANTPLIGRAHIAVPLPRITAQGSRNLRARASVTVPMIKVAPHAYVGSLARASITIPLVTVDASGYFNVKATADITVPLVDIVGRSQLSSIVVLSWDGTEESVTGLALVMNIENAALTEYDNYGFNSFASFNGKHLGASSSGIFDLSGDTDNGTRIASSLRTALTDGGADNLKGIEDVFIGLSTDGILEANVITDGDRSYALRPIPARESDAITTERLKAGKGIKNRYLALEIKNKAGADFTIESAKMTIVPMARKM